MKQVGWLLVFVACAHTPDPDANTGTDGMINGAERIALNDNEANADGVVTFPGGDRVDWKSFELPAGQEGTVDLELRWQAPRSGGQLSFDVFDRWHTLITEARATSVSRRSRSRSATIDHASGKYFVRVYAPRTDDAGDYKLVVNFKADEAKKPPPSLVIPDPPKLPSVPPPEAVCEPFDINNKACKNVCPDFGAPQGWPPCADKEKRIAEEQARIAAEKLKGPPPAPVTARILSVSAGSDGLTVKIGIGTNTARALDKTWRAEVLHKATGKPLGNGVLLIVSVEKTQTIAKTTLLTTDQLYENPNVRLSPAPSP